MGGQISVVLVKESSSECWINLYSENHLHCLVNQILVIFCWCMEAKI